MTCRKSQHKMKTVSLAPTPTPVRPISREEMRFFWRPSSRPTQIFSGNSSQINVAVCNNRQTGSWMMKTSNSKNLDSINKPFCANKSPWSTVGKVMETLEALVSSLAWWFSVRKDTPRPLSPPHPLSGLSLERRFQKSVTWILWKIWSVFCYKDS